jgi:hypothetical protein
MTTTKFNPKSGQNNPLRRVPGGFLVTRQREQLARAGRDIHGNQILPPNPHRIHFDEIELAKEQERVVDAALHGFTATDAATGERIDPATIVPEGVTITDVQVFDSVAEHHDREPEVFFENMEEFPDEYEMLKAEAKRRKKSFKKVASAAGWELVGPTDAKSMSLAESWQRRV